MQRITHSLKQLWHAERILRKQEMRAAMQKTLLLLFAALVLLMGLVMLELAAFFALIPRLGRPWAAVAVTGINVVIALVLMLRARTLKPPAETELVQEARDMAMDDLEDEASRLADDIASLRRDFERFVHHPADALLPAIGPLVAAISRGVTAVKDKAAAKKEAAAAAEETESDTES